MTLALRTVFEPVMVSYYVWPPLAVALVAASRNWIRLLAASTTAIVLTFLAHAMDKGDNSPGKSSKVSPKLQVS